MKNIDSDLIRGNIDTIILKTMLEEDKYGLDIIKEVEQRSNGTYELKQPTLYSCLKRLENQQLISSYWKNSDIGGKRHYYKLTDKGREFYNAKQEEWAKSKFVIDNLLSNYNYEEYRLVKKDDYDKAMASAQESSPSADDEPIEDETTDYESTESQEENQPDENDSSDFFEDDSDSYNEASEFESSDDDTDDDIDDDIAGINIEDEDFENLPNVKDLDNDESEDYQTEDFPSLSNDDDLDWSDNDEEETYSDDESKEDYSETEEQSFDEEDEETYSDEDEEISEESEDDVVYVSNSYQLNEEYSDDDDEVVESKASYDLADQSQNENNILNMLRKQENEEINTYEGDKKSYASQIRSIYDDVKYVQDDMIVSDANDEDEVDFAIKEFTAAAEELNNFNSEMQNEKEDDIQTEDIDEDFEDTSADDNFDEVEEQENSDEVVNDEDEFEDLNLSASDDDVFESFDQAEEDSENMNNFENNSSFFDSDDSADYDYDYSQSEESFDDDSFNSYSENQEDQEEYQNDYQEESFENDFDLNYDNSSYESAPLTEETIGETKFNQDAYDSTFVNVKRDVFDSYEDDSLSAENLKNSDIDSIISKNASDLTTKSNDIFFERRYVSENYKQKLSNLTIYSKATETQQKNQNFGEIAEADDMETLKLNFEREGIKVKEYKKSNSFEQPEKNYLLTNKINLIKSIILLLGYVFVLSAMYIVLENSSFGIMTEGFDIKYFLFGMIPFALIALYHLIIFIINPYKKVPARYASRIMIFISVIITVQLLLITYCVNLQLGFYSFVQAGYNHLLWLIPSIISFGPIISTLIYMALYYSNNFNV